MCIPLVIHIEQFCTYMSAYICTSYNSIGMVYMNTLQRERFTTDSLCGTLQQQTWYCMITLLVQSLCELL